MEKLVIERPLMEAIASYLSLRPYREVAHLIAAISRVQSLTETTQPEQEGALHNSDKDANSAETG